MAESHGSDGGKVFLGPCDTCPNIYGGHPCKRPCAVHTQAYIDRWGPPHRTDANYCVCAAGHEWTPRKKESQEVPAESQETQISSGWSEEKAPAESQGRERTPTRGRASTDGWWLLEAARKSKLMSLTDTLIKVAQEQAHAERDIADWQEVQKRGVISFEEEGRSLDIKRRREDANELAFKVNNVRGKIIEFAKTIHT